MKEIENKDLKENLKDTGYLDIAGMDVQAHIVIKDADSKEVLLNKRG